MNTQPRQFLLSLVKFVSNVPSPAWRMAARLVKTRGLKIVGRSSCSHSVRKHKSRYRTCITYSLGRLCYTCMSWIGRTSSKRGSRMVTCVMHVTNRSKFVQLTHATRTPLCHSSKRARIVSPWRQRLRIRSITRYSGLHAWKLAEFRGLLFAIRVHSRFFFTPTSTNTVAMHHLRHSFKERILRNSFTIDTTTKVRPYSSFTFLSSIPEFLGRYRYWLFCLQRQTGLRR